MTPTSTLSPPREDLEPSKSSRGLCLASLFLALLLILAAGPKLLHPSDFQRTVAAYGLLPASWVGPFAASLPWLECLLALGLLLRPRPSAGLACALFLVFSGALAFNLFRGRHHACGCFDSRLRAVSAATVREMQRSLAGTAALAGLAGVVWLRGRRG